MFKAGLYLLNFPSIAIYEIIAYCGYKFVGVTANIIFSLIQTILEMELGIKTLK
jgi:hypothetical protein